MTRQTIERLARRALVLAMTASVLAIGVATVQAAAEWRATQAPLDAAPVSMNAIEADAAVEAERAGALAGQIDEVAAQVAALDAAVVTANEAIAGDAESAGALQERLDGAKAKLEKLQDQLAAAKKRLAALNAAADRQAALNAAARSSGSGGSGARDRGDDHEDEDEEDEEDEHDDD